MKIISLVNHKGGVGKTTSAVNIAAGLCEKGLNVLLVDADAQANLTKGLGILEQKEGLYKSFVKGSKLPIIRINNKMDIVPNSIEFAGVELEISNRLARETILKKLLEGISKEYDYIIIDCPPSLGLVTINALVAAEDVLIPVEAEYYAYVGINSIVGIINEVRQQFNKQLRIKGVFYTKYNEKRVLTKEIKSMLMKYFGETMMQTKIRMNVALAEAQLSGKDVFEYDPECNGAKDYRALVNEILKK